jgi:TP901-1 family phage major tail protein
MAADTGRNMLLKLGTGTGAVTIAGARVNSMTVNGEIVDITTKDDGGRRVLLGTGGVSSVQMGVSGILTAGTASNVLSSRADAKSLDLYTFVWDGTAKTSSGSFQVSNFSVNGEYNGAQTFEATLESSGTISGL